MENLKVNDIVFSPIFGIGKVAGFEKIDGSEETFVIIESREKNFRSLIPIKEINNFRKKSTPADLRDILAKLKRPMDAGEFESKKHRIIYFKERSINQNIDNVIKTILELRSISDRGKIETQILESLVDSISKEIEIVLEVDRADADKILKESFAA